MAKVIIKFKGVIRGEVTLSKTATAIGRTQENEITLENLAVSRSHAIIMRKGEQFVLEDLESRNGTYVNGKRIHNHPLNDGDSILVGKHNLLFVDKSQEELANSDTTPASNIHINTADDDVTFRRDMPEDFEPEVVEKSPAPAMPESPEEDISATSPTLMTQIDTPEIEAYLAVVKGDLSRTKYHLTNSVTSIGKDDNAEIRLTGLFTPRLVGVIHRRKEGYFLAPVGRGIKLNDVTIAGKQKLMDGNVIKYKDFTFRFKIKA
ncbi:MAG: FHA domain-containing protein [Magnetococcales bacterium]|nr:FHA domain-containing protein [Magnetococcales bacterium]